MLLRSPTSALDDGTRLFGRLRQQSGIIDSFGNAPREQIGVRAPGCPSSEHLAQLAA